MAQFPSSVRASGQFGVSHVFVFFLFFFSSFLFFVFGGGTAQGFEGLDFQIWLIQLDSQARALPTRAC